MAVYGHSMRELALHQITMMHGGPEGLVRFAASAGIYKVCLFTTSPKTGDGQNMFPVVEARDRKSFESLLADTGVSLINAEYFPIMPGADVDQYGPALALASDLGAKRAVTHIYEEDPVRIADQLGRLCDIGQKSGLDIGLEFTGFSRGCTNLEMAIHWQDDVDQPNLKIAVDALHFFRSGGTLSQLKDVHPDRIGYAQICDGTHMRQTKDYLDEAMNRTIPGEGVFPLRDFVALFGEHVDLDIEVPGLYGDTGINPERWAWNAIAGSRKLFDPADTTQ